MDITLHLSNYSLWTFIHTKFSYQGDDYFWSESAKRLSQLELKALMREKISHFKISDVSYLFKTFQFATAVRSRLPRIDALTTNVGCCLAGGTGRFPAVSLPPNRTITKGESEP